MTEQREPESEAAKLAKNVVEAYVKQGKVPDVADAAQELRDEQAGVFVCLKTNGELRGCIGTIKPCTANLAEEIRRNAVSSAANDPRFAPVGPEELPDLTYTVDVLGEPEEVADLSELDAATYGVIVTSGGRTGLLLPDLEGVTTPDQQVRIAMSKAGIRPGDPVKLQRFKVTRHE